MGDILFIEANSELKHLVQSYFQKTGINVIVVSNASEARVAIADHYFDLLVLDIVDGPAEEQSMDFVKELRMDGIWIPACFYTTRTREDVLHRLHGYNCLDLIPKDVSPDEMVKRVKDMLFLTSERGQQELAEVAVIATKIEQQFESLLIQMNSCCALPTNS